MEESPKPPPIPNPPLSPGKKPVSPTGISKRNKGNIMQPVKEEILPGAPLPPIGEEKGMDFDIDMATGVGTASDEKEIQSDSLSSDAGGSTADQQTLAEVNAKRLAGKNKNISMLPAIPELSIEAELFRDGDTEDIDAGVIRNSKNIFLFINVLLIGFLNTG